MDYMFNNCVNLTTIYVGEKWSNANVIFNINTFNNCTKLVGGNGTTYSILDASYARVDTAETPGYLTLKTQE